MSNLTPPDYQLPPEDIEFLQHDLEDQLLRRPRASEALTRRRRILGHHGERATELLLRRLGPAHNIENMNAALMNHPGFDFRVDSKVRVQAKGRCWVELIDFTLSPLDKQVAWNSDIWITVDFSGFLDGRIGRLSSEPVGPIGRVRWFVAPTEMLKDFVERRCADQKRIRAQYWRTSKANTTKYHYPELARFQDAFHWINKAI